MEFFGIEIAIAIGIESFASVSSPIAISIPISISIWIDYPPCWFLRPPPAKKNGPLAGAGEEGIA
jgi:hypothetical protein